MTEAISQGDIQAFIGKTIGSGDWFAIDQGRINHFADITLDHQFIHVDEPAAAKTALGGTIAHGFLVLSLLAHLIDDCGLTPPLKNLQMGMNYGFDKVRFINPVRPGDQLRAHVVLADAQDKGEGRVLLKSAITVEIKGQTKPALVCEWLNMLVFN